MKDFLIRTITIFIDSYKIHRIKLFLLFICSWKTAHLPSFRNSSKARAPRQKYTSSIRSIPLNSTTLFTCTFLDPARFNLHERVARTSIKRIVELFAIVYLPKKDTFTDGEAWRKIATPTASCPLPSQRRNVDSDANTIFLLFLLFYRRKEEDTRGSVISHVEG